MICYDIKFVCLFVTGRSWTPTCCLGPRLGVRRAPQPYQPEWHPEAVHLVGTRQLMHSGTATLTHISKKHAPGNRN